MIQRLPGIIVAQTESANTLVRWARSGFQKYEPRPFQNTIASAMNIQDPVSFPRIQRLRKHFRMEFFDVSEDAIQRTRALFMRAGANICPQSAVALDAVIQARANSIVEENDVAVAISTASGLKFTKAGIEFHTEGNRSELANPPIVVDGNLEAIEEVLA
jgi:threonine synthase